MSPLLDPDLPSYIPLWYLAPPSVQATVAYLSGHRDLAGRLSSQARKHGDSMAEADARAAAHIFWARNPASASRTVGGGPGHSGELPCQTRWFLSLPIKNLFI
jgi:hypothetical protein